MKFYIEIREELSRIITVEAPDDSEAEEKVRKMYENSEIVLNYNDLAGEVGIEALGGEVPNDFPVHVIM